MAPRKAKAAGEDDRPPELKLIMEKGPLSGQIFGFSPRCVIRLGRTARGNTLAVLDAGVSTKHLLIQVEAKAVSGDRRWTITDLGSSNGTILNDESLESSVVLSDGDIIKIGEETSIRVELGGNVVENEVSTTITRRNARRGVRGKTRDLRAIDEFSELGLGDEEDEIKTDVVAEVEVTQEGNVNTRRIRSSRNNQSGLKDLKADESKDLGLNEVRKSQGVSTRRTRNSTKEGDAVETAMDLSLIEGRKTRGRKKKPVESIPEETEKVGEDMNTEVAGLESTSGVKESNVSTGKGKIQENSKGDSVETAMDLSLIEGWNKKPVETIPEDKNTGKEDETAGLESTSGVKESNVNTGNGKIQENNNGVSVKTVMDLSLIEGRKIIGRNKKPAETIPKEAEKVTEDTNTAKEDEAAGLESTSGVRQSNVNTGKEKISVDLETMSMGEWFDFLEVYLPQQIIEETEAKIAEMRQTAERFHNYMVQQKKSKAMSEVTKV